MSQRRGPVRSVGLTNADYRLLADFRHVLRQFYAFSEEEARAAGITAQQHLVLLTVKAFDGQPTVGDMATLLLIKHHSVVGMADRLARAGLIARSHDPGDRRRVTLSLTARGEKMLLAISGANRQELRRIAPVLKALVEQLET